MLLEVEHVSVRYGSVVAVADVSCTVDEGEIVVVVGPNGAGKTSLLRGIAALERKTAGAVRFRGRDISKWRTHRIVRNGLALVPEGRRIFAPLSVEENLLVGGFAVPSSQRASDLEQAYALFPVLHDRRSRPAGLLSGGEQQMLAIGRALMSSPALIMMDEPSMGLAPVVVDLVMEKVHEIAAQTGTGILMVEQNAAAASRIANSMVVLERGEVKVAGPAELLRSDAKVIRAFLGDKADNTVDSDRRQPKEVSDSPQ